MFNSRWVVFLRKSGLDYFIILGDWILLFSVLSWTTFINQRINHQFSFVCLFVFCFFFLLFSWEDWEMKFSIYHSERFIACLNTTLPWNDVKVRGQPRGWRSHGWSFDSHWPLSRRTALKGFYYGIFPVILPISCLLWLVISPYTLFYR